MPNTGSTGRLRLAPLGSPPLTLAVGRYQTKRRRKNDLFAPKDSIDCSVPFKYWYWSDKFILYFLHCTPTLCNYDYINITWYRSRWYDSELGRFVQPDSIVPGVGEGGNPNAVGYLGASTYTPLIVDFHEAKFLEQVNFENRAKLDNPNYNLPLVPTNSIAFDRYAYSLNNPVRYNDPTGHCPFCVAFVATLGAITPLGWVVIGVTTAAVVVYFAVPGVREAVTDGIYQAGNAASTSIQTLFAKGEYVPPGLGEGTAERAAYREALHRYKDAYSLGATYPVEKWILDKIAELAKQHVKPNDIVDQLPDPTEGEDADDWEGDD